MPFKNTDPASVSHPATTQLFSHEKCWEVYLISETSTWALLGELASKHVAVFVSICSNICNSWVFDNPEGKTAVDAELTPLQQCPLLFSHWLITQWDLVCVCGCVGGHMLPTKLLTIAHGHAVT